MHQEFLDTGNNRYKDVTGAPADHKHSVCKIQTAPVSATLASRIPSSCSARCRPISGSLCAGCQREHISMTMHDSFNAQTHEIRACVCAVHLALQSGAAVSV